MNDNSDIDARLLVKKEPLEASKRAKSNFNDSLDKDARFLRKEERLEAKRLAEEEELEKKREQALKGMKYLLGISEKYSAFFQQKVFSEDKRRKPLQENNIEPVLREVKNGLKKQNKQPEGNKYADVSKFLKYFEGGALRPYQLDGVTWMMVLYENGLNGILADEMGLGKTIQIIAVICHLFERKVPGPYLIIVPLSTLPNWKAEFKKFAPQIPVMVYHGPRDKRQRLMNDVRRKYTIGDFASRPVVLTSYQMPMYEQRFFQLFKWQYIIVDEGQRVKNHESQLAKYLRTLNCFNKLILTGTPLQNNITELWALLNFLLPDIFKNMDTFASLIMLEDMQDENKLLQHEQKNNLISTIHKVLAPFMLRRLKKDVLIDMVPKKEVVVYCPLSKLQRDLYSYVIAKNLTKLRGLDNDEESETILDGPRKKRKCVERQLGYSEALDADSDSDFEEQLIVEQERKTGLKLEKKTLPFIARLTMQNTMMMFRKIVNHPFLVHFPLDPNSTKRTLLVDENLVEASGKLLVLDTILPLLRAKGHKVLIFSTLVMMLDFIEEFMLMRDFTYLRLDGSSSLEERGAHIAEFNNDPNVFAFLISTRAGGLGLNLTGADTVIFVDNDWNPQADIQAQDRCHRIGQTRPVVVYTLVTRNTIDETIIVRGHRKRMLEKIIIKDGKFKINQQDRVVAENELKDLQKLLEQENNNPNKGHVFSKEELDQLMDRSDLYKIMEEQKKKEKHG